MSWSSLLTEKFIPFSLDHCLKISVPPPTTTDEFPPDAKYKYEVEEIIRSCITRGQQFYLIKWKGYSSKEATWEKASYCNCPQIIKVFHTKYPKQTFLGGANVMS